MNEHRNQRDQLIDTAVRKARIGNTKNPYLSGADDAGAAEDVNLRDDDGSRHPFILDLDALDDVNAYLM